MLALLHLLAVAAAALARGGVPAEAPAHFVWPAQGTITTPFVPGGHPGLDIGLLRSLTIRAAARGVVTKVGEPGGFEGYGRIVQVNVGGGYSTLYAHTHPHPITREVRVEAGEPIGVAGCTGWCTGTHLHFEVRLHGRPVNPLRIGLG